jgi:hypothetical protein
MEPRFEAARLSNLRDCGFPIERVIATNSQAKSISPKANALRVINPVAMVDDYLPYLRGLPPHLHAALIMREPNGSPNTGEELAIAHSIHPSLADFAQWWLQQGTGSNI